MHVIGLTGGVASGKSTVAALFAARGVPMIDTDLIARELVAPGQAALMEIVARFGRAALHDDGSLDRAWLRRRIFAEPSARKALEAILHPRIRSEVVARLHTLRAQRPAPPYVLLIIPLLVESGAYDALLDRVLVVDLPEGLQLQRLMARDGVDEALARAMLAAQASRAARRARADDLLDNRGPPQALEEQVARLHAFYSALETQAGHVSQDRL